MDAKHQHIGRIMAKDMMSGGARGRVFKLGRKWAAREIETGETCPQLFDTKRAAMEWANSNFEAVLRRDVQ
jgi:hypothetical protein